MSDRVLIPLPDGRWLALEPTVLQEALEAGAELIGPRAPQASAEPLLEASDLAALLGVPVTRIEALGRRGEIPSLQIGRRRRFRRSEVERALST